MSNRTAGPYEATDTGLVYHKMTKDGPVPYYLTNFTARIIEDITEDDGVETFRSFKVVARIGHREATFTIPASQFASMSWHIEKLGAEAVIYPGFSSQDHARTAIQVLSGRIPKRNVFRHTGWCRVKDQWCYLHAGGAIGPNGPILNVGVALPTQLSLYCLPAPPTGDKLRAAVKVSLRLLTIGPPRIMVPLLAAVFRAVLGPSDFSLHLAGRSGVFKTELAALGQRFFGQDIVPNRISETNRAGINLTLSGPPG